MATNNTPTRMIALSNNAAELLDVKRKLDECYDTLAEIQDRIFGYEDGFDDKLCHAYTILSDIAMKLLTEDINTTDACSKYEVI